METWYCWAISERNAWWPSFSEKDVANAQGGIGQLSKKSNLNRQGLYRALSKEGNPRLETLVSILKTLGLRLSVKPIESDLVA